MTKLKLCALLTICAWTIGVVVASQADAVTWGKCVEVAPGLGKYTDADCQVAGAGKFEWSPYTKTVKATSKGALTLTDAKGGLFGEEVSVECTVTDKGTVGPEAADETTEITPAACKTVKGTCPSPTAKAVNLPWKTKLFEEGGYRDSIEGANPPGWEVSCTGVKDTCSGNTSIGMKNILEGEKLTGKVEAIFEKAKRVTCSRGGAEAGFATGVDVIELEGGGA